MNLVDIAFLELSSARTGLVQLTTVEEFDPDIDDEGKAVETMNRQRRPIGMQHGVPKFKFSMTVVKPRGKQEVPWEEMHLKKTRFLLTYEESEGGARFQFVECWINKISKPFKVSGELKVKIECAALDHRPAANNP